ncbi:MAG: V-type ATPase subunit [Treponema sp.]|nr:V-type ATPase subunit [Treponema sp.]
MDTSSASSYVYAKASGILARSYTGSRAAKLFGVQKLAELWPLIFDEEVPAVPEILLAKTIEQKAAEKFIFEYKKLLTAYDRPAQVLVDLLQYFDYENLKFLGAAAAAGQKDPPLLKNIKPYNLLNYSAWPSIQKITQGSELEWYNKAPQIVEQQQLDNELDLQFIEKLWTSSQELFGEERKMVQALISERYSMRNVVWVLRLKLYYGMDRKQIVQRLAFLNPQNGKADPLGGEALAILDKDVQNWDDWKNWKYAKFLNPREEGSLWSVDPRWVEESSEKEFINKATKKFHANPCAETALLCWYFIKSKELDYIRMATEALRLNVKVQEI